MKLPNGYGSVYKLSGNRRKPYAARKTTGFEPSGTQKYTTIGYYATKAEALQALAAYNANPYDISAARVTFSELYEKWARETFDETTNRSTRRNYEMAFNGCAPIHDMLMADIRLHHLQEIVDSFPNSKIPGRIKTLLNQIYTFCIRNEILQKNYAELIKLPKYVQQTERRAMSRSDIDALWSIQNNNIAAQTALILIYSGVRINELLNLRTEDVNLNERYFKVRESKTSSGIRIVPIADKTLPFWHESTKRSKCEYAITSQDGDRIKYENFTKTYWKPLMLSLGWDYTIHETRHTCNSLLIMANVNPTVRKKIMGHKSQMDIGEAVYGHIYIAELLDAINAI